VYSCRYDCVFLALKFERSGTYLNGRCRTGHNPMIKVFAEGLRRLGVINVQIHLDTPSEESTTLSTHENDKHAILHHAAAIFLIRLPSPSSSTKDITLPLNQTTITCRVSTFPTHVDQTLGFLLSADDINVKWSRGADLSCAKCHHIIVQNQPLRWKDLPSDSWEEYSDYWHCHPGSSHFHSHSHSPSQIHTHHQAPTQPHKPFVLLASPGTALVGLTYLLIHSTNTQNITFEVPVFPSADLKKGCFYNPQRCADAKVLYQSFSLFLTVDLEFSCCL
jgi:hypothetical protein